MIGCINKSSREFRRLKQTSGLPESDLETQCRIFLDKYDRFPNLDELVGVNSESAVKEALHMGKSNVCSIDTLFKETKTDNIDNAVISLNSQYKDLQIQALQLKNSVILDIQHKPQTNVELKQPQHESNIENNFLVFNEIADKLNKYYGVPIQTITIQEMQNDPNLSQLVDAYSSKAFIYNDTIYINTDIATIDSPIHELLHIFVGSMRTINPDLYYSLVQTAEQFQDYEQIAKQYPNRTQGDLDEEVFIQELAKYLTGQVSNIDKLPNVHEIIYTIQDVLNTTMMGNYSAQAIDDPYNDSIRSMNYYLDSNLCEHADSSILKAAKQSRQLANMKEQLLTDKVLQEECD